MPASARFHRTAPVVDVVERDPRIAEPRERGLALPNQLRVASNNEERGCCLHGLLRYCDLTRAGASNGANDFNRV